MKRVSFFSGACRLEGLLQEGHWPDKGVVVTHPHPLYGGDMYNLVVERIADAYQRKGYTVLRPNFRGVGNSEGVYDNGRGERQDAAAARKYLETLGIVHIDLAGYSFGAWINAGLNLEAIGPGSQIMISPPVAFMDCSDISAVSRLKLVVTGSLDEFAPPAMLEKMVPRWNPNAILEVIPGADHFYDAFLNALHQMLCSRIE
ncbi:MAG: alpha/beta hydrolase [Desulfobacterales bacterium]|nr:alpha/beta hydrolase [Desulfobacterales bacterium]MDD3952052.1 alpha/beta hydrolase [Desulfobacterales bacterium]MDD4463727.1 alpha/beta hydrolase [Desulfobacterales bacterium]